MSIDHANDIRNCIKKISELATDLEAKLEPFATKATQRRIDMIDRELSSLVSQLTNVRKELDAGKHEKVLLSLGKPDSIARFYAFSMVSLEKLPLDLITENRIFGSGIYAIYYQSSNVLTYSALAASETPIYVGKAIPDNPEADTTEQQGTALLPKWNIIKFKHFLILKQ